MYICANSGGPPARRPRLIHHRVCRRSGQAAAPPRPKLVLAIVVDQFRYDYLTRFRGDYHAGFDLLLTKGAVFTNARYEQFPTVTAVGHTLS